MLLLTPARVSHTLVCCRSGEAKRRPPRKLRNLVHQKISKFTHVKGCESCAGLFVHHKLPDGTIVHMQKWDNMSVAVRLCVVA